MQVFFVTNFFKIISLVMNKLASHDFEYRGVEMCESGQVSRCGGSLNV